ncbi:MAG: hypothetical protein KGY45_02020 [Hadesarchaea archaeon]|nr:hypothetical protein [Hadesarchaea archaeon]
MGAPKKFRPRYIAFKIGSEASKSELSELISEISIEINHSGYKPRIVQFNGEKGCGLIFSNHIEVDKLKEKLESKSFVKILGVSGTIKAARQKFLCS